MKKVVLFLAVIILLSVESNCQWYYKKYGVKDLNQLSQEQLNKRLRINKKLIGFNVGVMIVGTTFIIAGTHLINKANAEELSVEGFYNYPREKTMGIVFLSSGIICDICGLILLPLNLTEINKIKKVLGNPEIKLGLISCPTNNIINHSNISLIPGISLAIQF
jgi:hypothetical protein